MLLVFEFLKSSPAFQLVWSCCVLLCLSTLSCFILLFFFCALSCHLLPLLSLSAYIYVVRVSPYPLLCCFLMLCVYSLCSVLSGISMSCPCSVLHFGLYFCLTALKLIFLSYSCFSRSTSCLPHSLSLTRKVESVNSELYIRLDV